MNNIRNILVVTLSNIGDVVLTFPVVDILRRDYPQANMDLMVSVRTRELFQGNSNFRSIYIYNKNQSGLDWIRQMFLLRRNQYDLVVDMRNTFIPYLIAAKKRTPFVLKRRNHEHMRFQHLGRLHSVHAYSQESAEKFCALPQEGDEKHVLRLVEESSGENLSVIVIAPAARWDAKRWGSEKFAQLADQMIERYPQKIVFIADKNEQALISEIMLQMKNRAWDCSGKLTLTQLSWLLKNARGVITNDSAPLHLASYWHVPVIALFGPTNAALYGPWYENGILLEKKLSCPACQGQKEAVHQCLQALALEDVWNAVSQNWAKDLLAGR